MNDFKKKLQSRQILLVSGLLCACSVILLTRNLAEQASQSEHTLGFIAGVQTGMIAALLGFLVIFFVKNMAAMKSPEKMKKLYIAETDERTGLIRQKSGSVGMSFILYGLALATAVAGNINSTVFFSLLGACMFVALVFGGLKLYYGRKY